MILKKIKKGNLAYLQGEQEEVEDQGIVKRLTVPLQGYMILLGGEKTEPAARPLKMVCHTCGSEDVLADAYAEWNKEKQCYEVAGIFDKGAYCNQCDGETTIDEVGGEK